jgi:hypothetical protein
MKAKNNMLNPLKFLTMVIFMGITLGGCARIEPQTYANKTPAFAPFEFFDGKTTAKGVLQGRNGEVKRRFIADIVGELKAAPGGEKHLELREEFRFDDGEVQHRTWIIRKTGEHDYIGTAGDVVGEAIGKTSGNTMNLRYVLRIPVDGTTYDIRMDDWMYLIDEKTVMNLTDLSKFGFGLGRLSLVIYRD